MAGCHAPYNAQLWNALVETLGKQLKGVVLLTYEPSGLVYRLDVPGFPNPRDDRQLNERPHIEAWAGHRGSPLRKVESVAGTHDPNHVSP